MTRSRLRICLMLLGLATVQKLAQAQDRLIATDFVGESPGCEPIKNAPFTAEEVHTSKVPVRNDEGKVIMQTPHSEAYFIARDSDGRGYRRSFSYPHATTIDLLALGIQITWSDKSPVATISPRPMPICRPKPKEGPDVEIVGEGDGAIVMRNPLSVASSEAPQFMEAESEILAPRLIEGIAVSGYRQKRVYNPSDFSGMDEVRISERWYSPELGIVLDRAVDDLLGGVYRTQYKNIHRVEPSSSLFEVPDGMSVQDNSKHAR